MVDPCLTRLENPARADLETGGILTRGFTLSAWIRELLHEGNAATPAPISTDVDAPTRISETGHEVPPLSVESNAFRAFQGLLSASDMMFPFLAKVNAVDYSVYRVVAENWMDLLDARVKFDRTQGLATEKKQDRFTED